MSQFARGNFTTIATFAVTTLLTVGGLAFSWGTTRGGQVLYLDSGGQATSTRPVSIQNDIFYASNTNVGDSIFVNATGTSLSMSALSALTRVSFTAATGTSLTLTGNLSAGSSTVTTLGFQGATGSSLHLIGSLSSGSSTVADLSFADATGSSLGIFGTAVITTILGTSVTGTTLGVTALANLSTLFFTNATGSSLNLTGNFTPASTTVNGDLIVTGKNATTTVDLSGKNLCLPVKSTTGTVWYLTFPNGVPTGSLDPCS